jgi:hypothetical protein
MSDTLTNSASAGQTVYRGFPGIRCPLCGQLGDGAITLDLDTLDVFRCVECEGDFSPQDVQDMVAAWQRVLDWIQLAPNIE